MCCEEPEEIRGTHLSTIFLRAIMSIIITPMEVFNYKVFYI